MAQRHQRGWLKKETRSNGETWVLFYRTIRKSDGKRVENKIAIGLVRDFPDERSARAEVERLHLQLNPVDLRGGVTFADLALHYADHELVERTESINPRRTPQSSVTCGCFRTGRSHINETSMSLPLPFKFFPRRYRAPQCPNCLCFPDRVVVEFPITPPAAP